MTQKLGDGFEFNKKACFVCGSLNHLIKDCNFYENKMVGKSMLNNMGRVTGQREVRPVWNNAQRVNHQNKLTHPHPKRNFVPTAVLTKSGNVPVNTAKQSSSRAAVSNSTARYVNTAASRPTVNGAKPSSNVFHKSHSSVKRTIYQRTTPKNSNFNEKVNTAKVNNVTTAGTKAVVSVVQGHEENVVKSSACCIWRPTGKVIDHISKDSGSYMPKRFDYVDPQSRLKSDQGIFDSGCSRHMTGNKSYLTNYQDIDGGFVAFAKSPKGGKITRKGKIRTGKLDFEDVYFVKELKFNLFSVSQMCDKKNNVLFTETECLVLSPDFKLLDESQVLLKVPRQDKMYSFDLKNVVLSGGETLLEAYLQSFLKMTILVLLVRWESNTNPLNRVLVTKPHNKIPYELLLGRPPSKSFMRPFGCPMTILNTLDPLGKFDRNADEGFLVRYYINSKAFRVFNTRTKKVEENLHIKFLENKPNVTGSGLEWLFDINPLTKSINYKPVTAGNQTNDDAGLKSSDDEFVDDVGKKNNVQYPAKDYDKNGHEKDVRDQEEALRKQFDQETERLVGQGETTITNSNNRLNTVSATGQSFDNNDLPTDPLMPNLEESTGIFRDAYDDEDVGAEANLNNLETTINVQTLVDLPKGKRAIRTKWVYINKKDDRGIVVRNKVRLVAQGYTQEEGIDYDEVFDPVVKIKAIRLFLAYASFMGFIVYQMDMKSAFLYGTIKEEVYVCQPPGFKDLQFLDKVYKVYVDDIIFGSTKKSLCDEFEQMMHKKFQMSSMGELTFFLGLQVQQKKDGIYISQDKYVVDILKKFDFITVKTASTLTETNKALIKDEEAENVDFQVTPKTSHLHAVKRIIRYLKGQLKLGLWYPRDSPFELEAFSDSDYAGASLDMKSTIGGCQFFGKRLISWQCKKQTIVANSTTKGEYVAADNCCGQNPVFHSKTKHIEIRHYFIRDFDEKKLIRVIKIHTDHNVADLLTKAFDVSRLCINMDPHEFSHVYLVISNVLVMNKGMLLYSYWRKRLELKEKKELAIPGQTTTGKEFSNPLMVGSLPKSISAKEVDIIKKTENQAKMTKLSMEWKRLCKIKAKVRVNTEESAVKPEPELKNTIGCNLNPSDGPGKPNSITMKTVKTKWALNQLQQPICVQLTKTVKTLKAQS
ncbi:putative ribonuclease H-like domain-containing protein [Tanacetum coccineum]